MRGWPKPWKPSSRTPSARFCGWRRNSWSDWRMLIRRLEGLRGWAGLRLDGLRRMPGLRRLNSLRQDWPDALRMVISTVLAGTVSSLLHLPEMYWAVLSAVIVARPGAGGSTKAGDSRLIGTVFGSAVAMAV